MKLAVLNPQGRDPGQSFPDGAGAPGEGAHPPLNYHAFAACTGGAFYRDAKRIPPERNSVLLLLRQDLKASLRALGDLRRAGRTVAVAWKEAGAFQVAAQLASPRKLALFREICSSVDGAIATTPDLVPLFTAAGVARTAVLPTPYPIEDKRWDFSIPAENRHGIIVGTREFGTASRNHLAALLAVKPLAESTLEPVTVINGDGGRGRRLLDRLGFNPRLLRVIDGRLPYPRYLRLLAEHKLVWQLDASAVPGQVAGDALLARVPCVGGNGTTERLAFPDLCGHGRDLAALLALATRLLGNPAERETAVERALENAREHLSFGVVARRLEEFFGRIAR